VAAQDAGVVKGAKVGKPGKGLDIRILRDKATAMPIVGFTP